MAIDIRKMGVLSGCALPVLLGVPLAGRDVKNRPAQEKKNVLFLMVDDLRDELNCYGASYMKTPNIDALAREGVMFRNSYCNVPVSGASRASLLTGIRPGNTRFWDVTAEVDREAPGAITLPQYFREHGYYTISNSKIFHNGKDTAERSWDEIWKPALKSSTWRDYLGEENLSVENDRGGPAPYESLDVPDNAYADGKAADKTIADLRRLKALGKPFFLAMGILKPHLPFNAPKKYWDMYDPSGISVPETFVFDRTGFPSQAFHSYGEIRYYRGVPQTGDISEEEALRLIRGYRACVSYADAQVGRILDELKRLHLDKNTIVVLLGDHGWSLGDHNQWCKHSNFNIVTRAPLIIRIPGNKKKGVEEKVVEFVDIFPTLCEAVSLEIPDQIQGSSLYSLLCGEDEDWKDCAIVKWHSGQSFFNRDFGYTWWSDKQGKFQAEMLFDYSRDRLEVTNVVAKPEYSGRADILRQEILDRRGEDFMNH